MTYYETEAIVYTIVSFAVLASLSKIKLLNKASLIVTMLLFCTLISEVAADINVRIEGFNTRVYNLFCPIQFLLTSIYFNYTIDTFKDANIGKYIGIVGCALGIIDYFFFEIPPFRNTIYLLIEGITIVGMSLYAFYRILLNDDDLRIITYPHFWFTTLFLCYWTCTTLFWGSYDYISDHMGNILGNILLIVNIITYLGFGTVFLLYRKMQQPNE